uniref:TELO2-interacting protein 1 homolog isoform X2 n=1 Tax=Myxine glutinosa TaxID=7769 RepID=UPI00358F1927
MEEAFSLLYPICMNLTDDSTTWADGVPQLSEIISSMGDVELQEIKDFVVFPLRFILFRLRDRPASPRRNYLLEQALNCLEPLLLRVRVSKSLFLQQLLGELCVVLGCPTETSNVSEAVKLAVVKSIKALLRSASKDSLKSIFDVSYLPSLGHAVSTLLALAEREAARALRLHALECLLLLFQSEGDRATSAHDPATSTGPRASVSADRSDLTLPRRTGPEVNGNESNCTRCSYQSSCLSGADLVVVGDALTPLLPGIVISMSQIIMGDVKQGHKVTLLAVRAWMQVVLLVLDDDFFKNIEPQRVAEGISKPQQEHSAKGISKPQQEHSAKGISEPQQEHSAKGISEPQQGHSAKGISEPQQGHSAKGISEPQQEHSAEGISEPQQEHSAKGISEPQQEHSAKGISEPQQEHSDKGISEENMNDPRLAQLQVRRSADWVRKCMDKLSLLLQCVCTSLEVHQAWQVRVEAATFAGRLLTTSATSLGSVSQGVLLDLLLGTIRDDHPRVRARGQIELAKLFNEANQRFQFEDALQDKLYKTATHLVHLVRSGTDTEKLMVVGRLQGCILVLREHVSIALNSLPHLKQLLRSLFLLLAPDPEHGQLLDVSMEIDKPNYSTDWPNLDCHVSDWPMPGAPRKQFASFSEVCVYHAIQQVCRLLGYYGDLQLLTCEILEELHDSEQHRVAATMVLVEVIVGAAGCGLSYVLWDRHEARLSEGEIKQLSKALVEEFTSPQHWQLDVYQEMGHLKCDDNAWNGRRLMAIAAKPAEHLGSVGHFGPALHTVAWRLRVQIEGLAAFAGVLGPQFQPLLQSCLFPLLEKAGESSLAISHTARLALRAIARALRLPSPRHLVSDNVDYLLDAVSTGLRFGGTGAEGQAALRVLRATLQRSNRRSLPILRHVALDMLSALDVHHSTRATLYCSAILALAQALERWFAAPTDASEASHNPSTSCSDQSISPLLSSPIDDANGCMEDRSTVPVSAKDVERFFLEYHRNRRLAQGKPESGDPSAVTEVEGEVQDVATTMAGIGEVPEVSDSGSEGPSALPLHVCLGKELLERSTHLLPHHNLTVRLQMLEVAGCCVRVLRSHKEDLLPAANQLWFALVPRLLADDSCVVLAAFKLLGILAQSCGDFLRHRVISEVLPRLSSSLLNQAMISAREGALYSYTQASRLQYAALKSIGPMCLALGLVAEDIEKVAAAALPYLSNRQPKHLQESAIGNWSCFGVSRSSSHWSTRDQSSPY